MPTYNLQATNDFTTAADTAYGAPGSTTSVPNYRDLTGSANGSGDPGTWKITTGRLIQTMSATYTPYALKLVCVASEPTAARTLNQQVEIEVDATTGVEHRMDFRKSPEGGTDAFVRAIVGFSSGAGGVHETIFITSATGQNVAFDAFIARTVGRVYKYRLRVEGAIGSTTATAWAWESTDGGTTWNAQNIFSGGTASTQTVNVPAGATAPAGQFALVTSTGTYRKVRYYSDITGTPPTDLVLPTPLVTNKTTTGATVTANPSGGTPPYTFLWEDNVGGWGPIDPALVVDDIDDAIALNLEALMPDTQYNVRVTVTSADGQTQTQGVIFTTLPLTTNLSCSFRWVYAPGGHVYITAVPGGGNGNYTYAWSKQAGDTPVTLDNATINSATLHLTTTDVEVQHWLNLTLTDSTGKAWPNDTNYPRFVYPVKPWLKAQDLVVLRPTAGSAVALGYTPVFGQEGDSLTQTGSPYSIGVVATTVGAVKGLGGAVTLGGTGGLIASGYGGTTVDAIANQAAAVSQCNASGVTDLFYRVAYNDIAAVVPITAPETIQNTTDFVDYLLVDGRIPTLRHIWILPTLFRSGGPFSVGDGNESRLRTIFTGLSALHGRGGGKVRFCSTLPYDLTQNDRSLYGPDFTETTHPGLQLAWNTIGSLDASSFLTSYPVAANTPVTTLTAGASVQMVFPVSGTLANQAVTWTVARTGGGGAAYGTIDATGKYTAPSPLPTSAGAGDTITATSAGGAIATITVQLVASVSDVTAPTISSVVVGTNGLSAVITLSESCTGTAGFTFKVAGSARAATVTGSGTSRTASFASVVYQGQAVTYSYGGDGLTDAGGNHPATVTNAAVTNNSTQTVPVVPDPTPGGMVYIDRFVRGQLSLTPLAGASVDAPETCFVGDRFKLLWVLRDGMGEPVPIAVDTPITATVSANGTVIRDAADGNLEWGAGGVVSYLLGEEDTATSGKKQITVSVGESTSRQTWGPMVLVVKAR